jgi:hypothetical protein
MNERINELAVKAGAQWREGYVEQPNGDSVWQDRAKVDIADMDLAKFTESIVRECLNIMVDERQRQLGKFHSKTNIGTAQDFILMSGAVYTVNRINKHFGVKE